MKTDQISVLGGGAMGGGLPPLREPLPGCICRPEEHEEQLVAMKYRLGARASPCRPSVPIDPDPGLGEASLEGGRPPHGPPYT